MVEQIPSDSSKNFYSGYDDEWLPDKREFTGGSSSDSEAEDVQPGDAKIHKES